MNEVHFPPEGPVAHGRRFKLRTERLFYEAPEDAASYKKKAPEEKGVNASGVTNEQSEEPEQSQRKEIEDQNNIRVVAFYVRSLFRDVLKPEMIRRPNQEAEEEQTGKNETRPLIPDEIRRVSSLEGEIKNAADPNPISTEKNAVHTRMLGSYLVAGLI